MSAVRVIGNSGSKQRLSRTEFEQKVYHLIASNFRNYDMWYVIEERRKYNPKMSEYIYEQNRGNKPHVVEVYFDGDFVCDISSSITPKQAKTVISDGLNALMMKKFKSEQKKNKNKIVLDK